MEVACNVQCLRSVKNIHRISFWNAAQLALLSYREQDEVRTIIDGMGKLSAQAQHLRTPITDYNRIMAGAHNLFLCTTGIQGKPEFILAKGMLKVGKKNLYIRKDNGQLVEMSPLCVLDFYVHESCQRMGLGHELFEAMLAREKKIPCELGYDRPSAKFHSFLSKYYGLKHYLPQANQYVVFQDYFKEKPTSSGSCALDGWGRQSSGSGYLENSSKKDKVLHGRRANTSEISTPDVDPRRKLETDADADASSEVNVAGAGQYAHQRQQLCGRRQSRYQMADIPFVNKVSCFPNSNDTQMRVSSPPHPVTVERDKGGIKSSAAEQYQPSTYGRRSIISGPSGNNDARKRSDEGYVRYDSPPSLPKPLEDDSKDENYYSPHKLLRTENTRSRLFHEDSYFQKSRKRTPVLKCPFWAGDPKVLGTKIADSLSKIDTFAPVPATFERTRSYYHAGMRGCGAAEAMGYSNGLIKINLTR